ncbi:MAG TPA: hypothetical protein VGO93_20370 [Candidatus Xenobia bacterium]|jgi:hypothetical protein
MLRKALALVLFLGCLKTAGASHGLDARLARALDGCQQHFTQSVRHTLLGHTCPPAGGW